MDSEGYRGVVVKARFLLALSLAFGSLFFVSPARADDVATVWENNPVGVYLPEGVTFVSVSGWYGSPDDATCGVDVSNVLTALAVGQNNFSVDASNSVFGDPCGGVYKVLKITGVVADWGQQVLLPVVPSPDVTAEPVTADAIEPVSEPTALPMVEPVAPVVQPIPAPMPAPAPEPAPLPPVEPTPAPTVESEPAPTVVPAPPSPAPIPASLVATVAPTPPPVVVVTPPAPPAPPVDAPPVADLIKLDPQILTDAQVEQITAAAVETLATEPQGSPAYNQALEQLMVVAQADDPQVPTELASIPLLGNAAVAVLDAFNQLGNFGSDISPKVRKQAKKEAIATIAVGTATTASTVAAAGSVGYRRKVTP